MRKTHLKPAVFAAEHGRSHRHRHLVWLLAMLAGLAAAQVPNPPQPAADAAAQITPLRYESALGSYRPYADAPLQSWRDANAMVGQIGGWRTYAKEAQAQEPGKERPDADPHSGHHGGGKP